MRRALVALVTLAAVVVGAVSVASLFGSFWWVLDLAAALRPHYGVALTGAAVAIALLGRIRRSAAVAMVALFNLAFVAPLWLSTPAPPEGEARLRVWFHNVHGGGIDRFEQVSDSLAGVDADVVFLSEMSPRWVEAVRAEEDLPFDLVHPDDEEEHRRLMALSRVPVLAVEELVLADDDRTGGVVVDVELDGRRVRLLSLHAESPRDAADSAVRDAELEAAGRWASRQTDAVVVIGDLNATPWSHAFRAIERRTGLRNSQLGYGMQPTWPAGWGPLMVPIDHAFHDTALTVTDRRTGPTLGSSHRSLMVEIAWRQDPP